MNLTNYYRSGAQRRMRKRRLAAALLQEEATSPQPQQQSRLLMETEVLDPETSEFLRKHREETHQKALANPPNNGIYVLTPDKERHGPMTKEEAMKLIRVHWGSGEKPKVWYQGLHRGWHPVERPADATFDDEDEEDEEEAEEEEGEEEADGNDERVPSAGGGVIGYWMIPYQGTFLKLKILEQYYGKAPRTVGGAELPLLRKKSPISHQPGGKWAPVFPILTHIKKLQPYFKWIVPREGNVDAIYDPDDEYHDEAIISYQRRIMSHGWYWIIVEGENAYMGGQDDYPDFFPALIDELRGGSVNSPRNVRLDASGVRRFNFVGPGGNVINTASIAEINRRFPPSDQRTTSRVSTQDKFETRADAILGLWQGLSGKEGGYTFDQISPEELADVFDAKYFEYTKNLPDQAQRISYDVAKAYVRYAKGKGWRVSPEFQMLGESRLDEVTYRRLYRLTAANGQYMIGGMRRINNVWVMDPSVPDRMSNARFVITRAPRIFRGEDGMFQIRYRFQSRHDRNTTGVAQSGYVKFLPPDKSFLKKVLQWAKRLFVAETAWDSDVHVWCSCPDFRYRWHWVLANAGASHEPTGIGGDALNRPPNQTNPQRRLCLCKHLIATGPFIQNTPKEFKQKILDLEKNRREEPALVPTGPNQRPEVAQDVDVELEDDEDEIRDLDV